MVWTNIEDVRLLTGLSTSDISDDNLDSLIENSQKEVLLKVNNKIVREDVLFIDNTRKNEINGSNTTYYIAKWEGNFISDADYDLDVDVSDVDVVSIDNSTGVETTVSLDSVSYSDGKFVVTTAQSNVSLVVSYSYSSFDPVIPHPLLKLATEYLAGAYSYMRIDSSQKKKVKFGNVAITNGIGKDSAYMFLYNKYLDIIRQLNENANHGAIWGISKELI